MTPNAVRPPARWVLALLALVAVASAHAQFVWPKAEYHDAEPGLYTEDPFIQKYRKEFFAVFRGDIKRFQKAYREIEGMVKKDPKDARARVWLGNGQTIQTGVLSTQGKHAEAKALFKLANQNLDQAVALKPNDPNIVMMRAVTLFVQGQYLPKGFATRATWEQLRDDCLWFIDHLGPDRFSRVSRHVRGETLGELGIAYVNLGEPTKAKETFKRLAELLPGTAYAERANKELASLGSR